ncbi:hypothetical protein AS189_07855 [Arthrobacter alpinus]|uniref:DUF8094 domain-containing protein n=1 Tax=Arthrobacter alpinus TaxID=656366 RepID=A0A0S2LYL7_9MICC|nr:hypothetical protein AS189_07855 [Arthrobacter alpinus]
MLGMFLRSKIAIVLAILGLLVLGTGIGQRTIWLPPATVTAATPAQVAAAPLTVIGPDLLKTRDGQFTMTIKSDGPMQLAVGREDDIIGWIGDASYTKIGAANSDFTQLAATSTKGEATVPNPAGSDMWVSEEKATGELTYTWQSPGRGDWALLLSADGKAAAPTDISITVDNEAGTPWAVPLMIIGSALLALAALMFLISPNKAKGTAAPTAGRRAAGRGPSDPATGALDVDKLVAAREAAKASSGSADAAPSAAAPSTIAEARKADAPVITPAKDAAEPKPATATPSDATSALPAVLLNPGSAADSDATAAAKDNDATVPADTEGSAATEDSESDASSNSKSDTEKDSGGHDSDGPDSDGPDSGGHDSHGNGSDGVTSLKKQEPRKPRARNKGGAAGAKDATPQDPTAQDPTSQDKGGQNKSEFHTTESPVAMVKKRMKASLRWGAALAAVLVAGSLSPAVAADPSTPAPASAAAEATPAVSQTPSSPGFPGLLDTQVQRIATAVATAVAAGDDAKNAKELETRVSGMALETREANYKIRAKVAKQAAMEPVNASKLLANVVTTTATWPRSALLVTQGENNALPQLLTLVQASPRENYKMVNATPLLPGQTFPKVDKEGTKEIALDSSDGLTMSPADAIAALSDRLTKSDSKFKDTFNDSVYIQSVLDTQATITKEAKDATYVFSHKAATDAAVNLRTADGGVMVVVGYNFGITGTSKANATLTVGDDAAVFTGGKETTTGFSLNYAEPVVMYIPPKDGAGKFTILSATRNLVGGSFKK